MRLGIWATKKSMGGIFLQARGHGESSSAPARWAISCLVEETLMAQGLGNLSPWRGHPTAHPGQKLFRKRPPRFGGKEVWPGEVSAGLGVSAGLQAPPCRMVGEMSPVLTLIPW